MRQGAVALEYLNPLAIIGQARYSRNGVAVATNGAIA
jgi:hypothetical protein